MFFKLVLLLFFSYCEFNSYKVQGVEAQTDNAVYCFQYTWMGPTFTNDSVVNGTCADLRKEQNPPICIDPLVYTADGSLPNTTQMWADPEIRSRVNCRLASNEVCASWTYYYDGKAENSSHLCTKITVDGHTPMKKGCEKQFKDGYTIEVCACTPTVRGPMDKLVPCNSSNSIHLHFIFIYFILIFYFFK